MLKPASNKKGGFIIWKDKNRKVDWGVRAEISIELNAKDVSLLKQIQIFFFCGAVKITERK